MVVRSFWCGYLSGIRQAFTKKLIFISDFVDVHHCVFHSFFQRYCTPDFFLRIRTAEGRQASRTHNFKGPQGHNDLLSTLVFYEKTKIIVLRYLPI